MAIIFVVSWVTVTKRVDDVVADVRLQHIHLLNDVIANSSLTSCLPPCWLSKRGESWLMSSDHKSLWGDHGGRFEASDGSSKWWRRIQLQCRC